MAIFFKDFNQQSMVDFLARLGCIPIKKIGQDYWYISIFRPNEKTPSFRVRQYNGKDKFDDFGNGMFGYMTELCLQYFSITEKELYQRINSNAGLLSFDQPNFSKELASQKEKSQQKLPKKYTFNSLAVKHPLLFEYLKKRGIVDQLLISQYLKEIHYKNSNGQNFYMIGFPNDHGGFAVRNKYFKGNIGSMGATMIRRFAGLQKIIVLEGFMDAMSFLSCENIHPENLPSFATSADILVLNSVVNLPKAIELMSQYACIVSMLDNDQAGLDAKERIKQIGTQYIDGSELYRNYKDLNEYWQAETQNFTETNKKQKSRGLKL